MYSETGVHPDDPSPELTLYSTYKKTHQLLKFPPKNRYPHKKEIWTHSVPRTFIETPLVINDQLCAQLTVLIITLDLEPGIRSTFVGAAALDET